MIIVAHRSCRRVLAALVVGSLLAMVGAAASDPHPAHAQSLIYVNTTDDPKQFDSECFTVQDDCSLRGAIQAAGLVSGSVIITACFDPDVVPGARPCPVGVEPLTARDPGFDPETGMWTIRPSDNRTYHLSEGRMLIDFRQGLSDWSSPADNRIRLDYPTETFGAAFWITSNDNVLAGFEITGGFERAAIYVPGGVFGDPAENNQLGPGLVFADITLGNAIMFTNDLVSENRVIGIWCGIRSDGTTLAPVREDCIRISEGSSENVIGDVAPENRNVFTSSELGGGIVIEGPDAEGNILQGNWFGLDAEGNVPESGLSSGIQLVAGPDNTVVELNLVSGNGAAGIALFDAAFGTEIRNNRIGVTEDDETCLPNQGYGITLQGGPIESIIEDNFIRCNASGGILLSGGGTQNNVLRANRIAENGGPAIHVIQGAQRDIEPPVIEGAGTTEVVGSTCPACIVEVFSDPGDHARVFEGRVTADDRGWFRFVKEEGFAYAFVTATATDDDTTSALADHIRASGDVPPTPTEPGPTATPGTPTATATFVIDPTDTPTSTTTPDGDGSGADIYLPWCGRQHVTPGR